MLIEKREMFSNEPRLVGRIFSRWIIVMGKIIDEEFARLTFPNGRREDPADEDLVILHAITANWGTNGPPETASMRLIK